MSNSLNKPDDQHRPEQRTEAKARMLMKMIWTIYAVMGALTLAFYVSGVWSQCDSLLACKTAPIKAIVWTALWPFFWMLYTNGLS
jgi:hypothetical protein